MLTLIYGFIFHGCFVPLLHQFLFMFSFRPFSFLGGRRGHSIPGCSSCICYSCSCRTTCREKEDVRDFALGVEWGATYLFCGLVAKHLTQTSSEHLRFYHVHWILFKQYLPETKLAMTMYDYFRACRALHCYDCTMYLYTCFQGADLNQISLLWKVHIQKQAFSRLHNLHNLLIHSKWMHRMPSCRLYAGSI